MENYICYNTMGGRAKIKVDVVPHKFICQSNRKRLSRMIRAGKRQKQQTLQDNLSEPSENIVIKNSPVFKIETKSVNSVDHIAVDSSPPNIIPDETRADISNRTIAVQVNSPPKCRSVSVQCNFSSVSVDKSCSPIKTGTTSAATSPVQSLRQKRISNLFEKVHKSVSSVSLGSSNSSQEINESQPKNDSETQVNKSGSNRETKHRWVSKNQVKSVTEQEHQCDKCVFKTKRKDSFKRHQLLHKDISEVQTYKCEKCEFETRHKDNLRQHYLRHRDPAEIQTYKCGQCSYKTKVKGDLKPHQLTHKNPSEVQMYKCAICRFITKHKDIIRNHQLTHKESSEIQMFECSQCSYKARRKSALIRHELTHKYTSVVQMYKCAECEFVTKHMKSLKEHWLRHRSFRNSNLRVQSM